MEARTCPMTLHPERRSTDCQRSFDLIVRPPFSLSPVPQVGFRIDDEAWLESPPSRWVAYSDICKARETNSPSLRLLFKSSINQLACPTSDSRQLEESLLPCLPNLRSTMLHESTRRRTPPPLHWPPRGRRRRSRLRRGKVRMEKMGLDRWAVKGEGLS